LAVGLSVALGATEPSAELPPVVPPPVVPPPVEPPESPLDALPDPPVVVPVETAEPAIAPNALDVAVVLPSVLEAVTAQVIVSPTSPGDVVYVELAAPATSDPLRSQLSA